MLILTNVSDLNRQDEFEEFRTRVLENLSGELDAVLGRFELSYLVPSLVGGKFFRVGLAHYVAGKSSKKLVRLTTALEMLHTSTLIHDDIIDRAKTRRRYPTVWDELGPEQAILIGNLLAARAISVGQSSSRRLGLAFADAYYRVNVSQEAELRFRNRPEKTIEDYLAICRGKTSAVLELAVIVGSECSDSRRVDLNLLLPAIRDVGIAFQIEDDIEDIEAWRIAGPDSRSKGGVFDLDLGNHTLPAMFLNIRLDSHETLRNASDMKWIAAAEQSRSIGIEHLQNSLKVLANARETSGASPIVARLQRWVERFVDSIGHLTLDELIKDTLSDEVRARGLHVR